MRVASKNNPTANGHCLLCLYCCMVYLACSSGLNLISTNWGISSSIAAPPLPQWLILEEPEKRLGKKMDKVANGEAHRQEVGVISSGSYQNHFLYDLSDAKRERKRDRKEMRMSETFWKEKKKSWCPQVFPHETWLSKLNQTNLRSRSSLSSHGNQIRKLMQCINETQCWTNEEQNSNDNGVNRGKWP